MTNIEPMKQRSKKEKIFSQDMDDYLGQHIHNNVNKNKKVKKFKDHKPEAGKKPQWRSDRKKLKKFKKSNQQT